METKVSKFTVTGLVKKRRIFNTSTDYSVDVFHYPCLTGDNGTGKSLTIHLLHAMTELITTSIPINHFYTFLPIKYVLVISCFIAMHCSCVSKNCNLMSLGLV